MRTFTSSKNDHSFPLISLPSFTSLNDLFPFPVTFTAPIKVGNALRHCGPLPGVSFVFGRHLEFMWEL